MWPVNGLIAARLASSSQQAVQVCCREAKAGPEANESVQRREMSFGAPIPPSLLSPLRHITSSLSPHSVSLQALLLTLNAEFYYYAITPITVTFAPLHRAKLILKVDGFNKHIIVLYYYRSC